MRDQPREPRTYELLAILSPDVPEEEIPGQLDRIAGYVAGAGGSVSSTSRESPWGRRRLAYSIRHGGRDVRDGFYTLFRLDLVPDRVIDVERELKLNTQVMRYLMTHFSPKAVDQRAIEEAEIVAEQAAADAYAAAQAEAARTAVQAAASPTEPEAAESGTTEPVAIDAPAAPAVAEAAPLDAVDAPSASAVVQAEVEPVVRPEPIEVTPPAAESPAGVKAASPGSDEAGGEPAVPSAPAAVEGSGPAAEERSDSDARRAALPEERE